MTLSRRDFLLGCIGAAALGRAGYAAEPALRRNLVIILGDDHRADLLGCAGHPILRTPHLDAMAREGVRFANACVTSAICCISRAGILTGMPVRAHHVENFTTSIHAENWAHSYPALLRAQGYRTGFFGKFGVGSDDAPADLFDEIGVSAYGGAYFPADDPDAPHADAVHCEAAESFIVKHASQAMPFCLSLSLRSPHARDYDVRPYQPAREFQDWYKDVRCPTPEELGAPSFDALPDFLRDSEGRRRYLHNFGTPERYQSSMRDYFGLLSGVDACVGRVRQQLKRSGIADQTVVIYLGDNGYFLGERGLEGKWYAYEQSIRIPMIIYDPLLDEARRGSVARQLVHEIDVSPTLLDYAGIPIPSAVYGRSLRGIAYDDAPEWRTGFLYQHPFQHPHIPRSEAVIERDWKYIRWIDGAPGREELYCLTEDPWECRNLVSATETQGRLGEMRQLHERYLAERIA